jgi:hypothetical protein
MFFDVYFGGTLIASRVPKDERHEVVRKYLEEHKDHQLDSLDQVRFEVVL